MTTASCGSESRFDATIAAASDTRDAFAEVAELVRKNDGFVIGFVFGSSGMLREQVLNDAPFDTYVSANVAFVDEVVAAGKGVASTQRAFALGRLAVISGEGEELPSNVSSLGSYRRIVIANPNHAPYGVAAQQAFAASGIEDQIEAKLILADSVADAVRIVESGEADVGVVALSLVINEPHLVVPESLHAPIRQSLVITSHGAKNKAAQRFVETLQSPEGREILARYGFGVAAP